MPNPLGFNKFGLGTGKTAIERQRDWAKTPKGKASRRRTNWDRNGIEKSYTYEEHLKLLVLQDFKCACCTNEIDETAHVDHDHKTGKVRGILCGDCNKMLAFARDNEAILLLGAYYLHRKR